MAPTQRRTPNPALWSTRSESAGWNRQLATALQQRLGAHLPPAVSLPAGKILLPAGQPVTRLPLLHSGRLDALLPLQGGESGNLIPISFHAGEIALLSQLFCNQPVWIDLVVAQDCTLRWLPVARLETLLQGDASLLMLLTRFLAHRLRDVQIRERGWVERGVRQRVLMQLVRLTQAAPADAAGHWTLRITHEELAARCGVSRPKLTLELKRLEGRGVLRRGRGYIDVWNLAEA